MNDQTKRFTDGLDPDQQAALGDLKGMEAALEGYTVPEPDAASRARLLAALEGYLPAQAPHPRPPEGWGQFRQWLTLARSQAALLEAPFWAASAIVFVFGLFLAALDGEGMLAVLVVFLSPAIAAGGVAYAFRPATRGLWELERITPTHPLELLYARLALVMGFNILLSLVLLAVIWLSGPQLVLWRLVLTWFGPLLGLAGLALYATVRWGTAVGIVTAMGVWGSLVSFGWWRAISHVDPPLAALWLLEQISRSDPLAVFSLLALAMGAWLLNAAGRLVSEGTARWS